MDKLLFPKASFNQETLDYWQSKLRATENAQPAIGTISLGYFNFLKSLYIKDQKKTQKIIALLMMRLKK